MSDEKPPPYLRHVQQPGSSPAEVFGQRLRANAQEHWDAGYSHFYLTVDSPEHTTRFVQWVENVGWRLEHVGWVWAQKGWVGFGGITLLNSGIVGNYFFGRPRSSFPGASTADAKELD